MFTRSVRFMVSKPFPLFLAIGLIYLPACEMQHVDVENGEAIYRSQCASCHQMDGMGLPGLYPPLVETKWVTGSQDRLVRVVLHGLTGPIMVRGETYRGAMPGHQRQMSDQQVVSVINYIRNTWGNRADSVSVTTVERIRSEEAGRRLPWTEDELVGH